MALTVGVSIAQVHSDSRSSHSGMNLERGRPVDGRICRLSSGGSRTACTQSSVTVPMSSSPMPLSF